MQHYSRGQRAVPIGMDAWLAGSQPSAMLDTIQPWLVPKSGRGALRYKTVDWQE